MEEKLEFEEIYEAYKLCLKNKKRKLGTYNFTNDELCKNLIELMDKLNTRSYLPQPSDCYVITDPALREIYAAQFSDRVVQHFYMKEIEDILETELVDGCCSCRKGRGTDYALSLVKKFVTTTSKYGKEDCYFLKVDLSGYFMSIDRKQVSRKFLDLIINKYMGKHKELLIYLTPLIFENNPALNCTYKCNKKMRKQVPERRRMKIESVYGMAIGNLTAQAASNVNLCNFDNYIINTLGFKQYVRYVDDCLMISESKQKLIKTLPLITKKLEETHQTINTKKTKIDTAYHGVPFLGKVTYPYGYQKPSKQVIIRVNQRAKNVDYIDEKKLLAKTNSQIGTLKKYNCKKLILNYVDVLPEEVKKIIKYDDVECKFKNKD